MEIKKTVETDVLVAGSGLAGIKAAKELSDLGHRVHLVTKMKIASGSSFYPLKASLGTQVTKDAEDEQTFLEDIEEMSRGMHREDLAEVYVREIPERVKEYPEIGVDAKKLEGERKACFAPNARNIYLLSDWDRIRRKVGEIFARYDTLSVMEKTVILTLIKEDGRVTGAVLLDANNDLVLVRCKAAILATGGFGSIYKHNLNPNDVDGSGHILALEAGARLVNMEFIQFIPGITSPKYKTLFGEHTLMYCKDIVDADGESLLRLMLPEGLSLRKCLEIRSTHGPFTHSLESKYFDIAMMRRITETGNEEGFRLLFDPAIYENKEEFYTVYLDWLKERNVNLAEDQIRIAPFAHASNGGVFIDPHGRTGVDGLYVIGELSCNIEGANRLGGNSTGACMVFGKRAAEHCAGYIGGIGHGTAGEQQASERLSAMFGNPAMDAESDADAAADRAREATEKIREILWYHANVVRSESGLTAALDEIRKLEQAVDLPLLFSRPDKRQLAFKARNFLMLSRVLLLAMLERKESRGAHYREDYPDEDQAYNRRLFVSADPKGQPHLEFLNE
ncbi:fumarate reductase [Bhargavaea cecembensis]|uniref:L-aspartate oxidase n=1 Tax=Bhargavaea cecembensis TaxID=394098 RepID=A0A161SMK6_9BACL|nr:FAD-binding protein [Bhargavaea cecembensis]KZE39113.1 fumarate reductase [Bhargavaea cecembensis]